MTIRRALAGCVRALAGKPLPSSPFFRFIFHTWCSVFMWLVDVGWEPAPVRPVCWSRTVRLGPYCPVSGRTCRICIVWLRIRIVRLRNRFVRSVETGSSGLWEPDRTVRLGPVRPVDEPDRPVCGIGLSGRSGYINRSPARLEGEKISNWWGEKRMKIVNCIRRCDYDLELRIVQGARYILAYDMWRKNVIYIELYFRCDVSSWNRVINIVERRNVLLSVDIK